MFRSLRTSNRLSQFYAGIGVALILLFLALDGWSQSIVYDIVGLSAAIAIAIGIRSNKPAIPWAWWLLAVGQTLMFAGDAVSTVYRQIAGHEPPFPSIPDLFYISSYPIIGAAFIRLCRVRHVSRADLLDAGIVAAGNALVVWALVLDRYLDAHTSSTLETIAFISYSIVETGLVAAAALLFFTPGARTRSTVMLIAAIAVYLTCVIVYSQYLLDGTYVFGGLLDSGFLLAYVTWGAAALHPSVTQRTTTARANHHVSFWRLGFLGMALLAVAPIWYFDPHHSDGFDALIRAGISAVLALLVCVRLIDTIKALDRSEQQFRSLVEQVPAVVYTQGIGDAAPTIYVNPHVQALLGYTKDEWQAQPGLWSMLLHPDDRERVIAADQQTNESGDPYQAEYRMFTKDGRVVWVREHAVQLRDQHQHPRYWQGISIEITKQKAAEAALIARETQFRLLFASNPHPMWVYDRESLVFMAVNDAAISKYGYERDEFLTMVVSDIYPGEDVPALLANLELEERPDLEHAGQWTHKLKDGNLIRAEITSHTLSFDGRAAVLVVAQDVTDRIALEKQLAHQAFHDPLTALPNRALLLDRLNHALARASRRPSSLAVCFLDLDDFKVVNDTLGHEAGDALLIAIAERLRRCVRTGDTVARLGGDEFALVLEDLENVAEAEAIAGRVADELRNPVTVNGRDLFASFSIGIAAPLSPDDRADDLLRAADAAMYDAKHRGKARFAHFDPRMAEQAWQRLRLAEELRTAVTQRQLSIVYQPLVELNSRHITEIEALVRWHHPERGTLMPESFVGLAEETGLIVMLGAWVLREACAQLKLWQDLDPSLASLIVAVNVSPRQLNHPGLVDELRCVLRDTGLSPRCLRLEITESTAIIDPATTFSTLREIKDLGVRLAIDDFGAGYAGLAYLRDCPVDALKIDQSYISKLDTEPDNNALVQTVLGVASTLGMSVTAEGIETEAQLETLRTLGCGFGQGFLLGEPQPPGQIAEMLDSTATHTIPTSVDPLRRRLTVV